MADDKKPDDKKTERKEGENITPTPTQKEADEAKVKVMGGDPKAEKRDVKDAKRNARDADEPPEALPPTPTQEENDLAKLAACNEDPTVPDNTLPPEGGTTKRAAEADKPGAYATRAKTPG